MKLYDLIQFAIVASAILISALYMLGRVAPKLRGRCAIWLQRAGRPRWLQTVGAKMAGSAGGCGSGCNTCGSCESTDKAEAASSNTLDKIPVQHIH
jgi:uncharacterized protein DUF6587